MRAGREEMASGSGTYDSSCGRAITAAVARRLSEKSGGEIALHSTHAV